jgi:hypothetical protein
MRRWVAPLHDAVAFRTLRATEQLFESRCKSLCTCDMFLGRFDIVLETCLHGLSANDDVLVTPLLLVMALHCDDELTRAYRTLDNLFIMLQTILKLESHDDSSTFCVMDLDLKPDKYSGAVLLSSSARAL